MVHSGIAPRRCWPKAAASDRHIDRKEVAVLANSSDFLRGMDEAERNYLESLVRVDYERAHPGDTFDDLKRRSAFSREDRGFYRDWMVLAAERASALRAAGSQPIAA
jgi:hypothetical protein